MQAHSACHALKSPFFLHRPSTGIELHDRGQKHSVQGAVMQTWVHAAQTVTQRMHATQPFLKRHGALHGRTHEVKARLPVTAVTGSTLNVRPATL